MELRWKVYESLSHFELRGWRFCALIALGICPVRSLCDWGSGALGRGQRAYSFPFLSVM